MLEALGQEVANKYQMPLSVFVRRLIITLAIISIVAVLWQLIELGEPDDVAGINENYRCCVGAPDTPKKKVSCPARCTIPTGRLGKKILDDVPKANEGPPPPLKSGRKKAG